MVEFSVNSAVQDRSVQASNAVPLLQEVGRFVAFMVGKVLAPVRQRVGAVVLKLGRFTVGKLPISVWSAR